VLAHEARPRIGRPRQEGQAGGIGYMACEIMARNCSEKNLNAGKIAATLSRAGQIIQRKSIDPQEQTQTIEETISNHGEHREPGEGEHTRCSQGGRGNHAWGQTGSGDCDTGQPPACGDSRLLAISAGLRLLRTVFSDLSPCSPCSPWFDSPRPLSLADPNWRTYTLATAAQIEANRLNAQRSTGPKTDEGKVRVRRNAITIMPVLPQEDPKELEDRTQQAITVMKPRNPLELDLVRRAVRLSGEIDRAERVGTAHLAHRVRMAARSGPETVSACELKEVYELGSKLFFQAGIGLGYPDSTGDDYPAVIVRRLEESAEGCRWLLARWAELRNVLDRKAAWSYPEIIRFVGLQGKRSIEAHFDPELNSLFHAFDALGHRIGHKFWNAWRDMLPVGYKGGFMIVPYREIAPPPSDETAALTLIRSVIERHVGRLNDLLAEHEEIEADEAAERYDRAALDLQPGIRAAPPLPVRPAPRAAANARNPSKNAEGGIRNGEWGRRKGGWQVSGGG